MRALKNLNIVSPMPPAKNGIADYMYVVATALAEFYSLRVFSQDLFVSNPGGAAVCDHRQLFRFVDDESYCLFQIGNNKDHRFVLNRLKETSGVVTLHDLSLLYLYEMSDAAPEMLTRLMRRSDTRLGHQWATHWHKHGIKTSANYVLFDMIGDVLDQASSVIVHSRFARNKICALYGKQYAEKLAVIPHYAPEGPFLSRTQAKAQLGLLSDVPLIVTSGFASKAKRFDWVIAALSEVARRKYQFIWVHAGEERESEFPLSNQIASSDLLPSISSVTGFLPEDRLDTYLSAADIVINLRFPSVGESSGTLARAFSAGTCCIVSDTAAYAELPRDCVVHVPIINPIPNLILTIEKLLQKNGVASGFGQNAKQWARNELSIDSVARAYAQVLDATHGSVRDDPSSIAVPREPITSAGRIIVDGSKADRWDEVAARETHIRQVGKFFMTFKSPAELVEITDACLFAEKLDELGILMHSAEIATLDSLPDSICVEIHVS